MKPEDIERIREDNKPVRVRSRLTGRKVFLLPSEESIDKFNGTSFMVKGLNSLEPDDDYWWFSIYDLVLE